MENQNLTIVSRWDSGKILFESSVGTIRELLEKTVEEGANLEGAYLEDAYLKDAYLKDAYLKGAYLKDAYLEGANLKDAYLEDANLKGANLEGAYLEGANLEGANLEGAYLEDAYLKDAYLKDAYLKDAYLKGANLKGAYLKGANLEGANLEGANLEGAYLEGANLKGAYLKDANLQPVRDDFWAILCASPREVPALRLALVEGRVNGSTYSGECACLVGTIANAAHVAYTALPLLKPNSNRPAERWFLAINKGDTPETNEFARIAVEWIDIWTEQMKAAFVETA